MGVARASLDSQKIPLKTEYVLLLATVQESIPRALVNPTRVLERSAKIKPKKAIT